MSAPSENDTYVAYKKRFIILLLESFLKSLYSFQTFEYTIIANIVKYYYGVSDQAVAFTAVTNFITVAVFVFPFGSFVNKYGIRLTFIVSSFAMGLATIIKCLSLHPNRFWLWLVGQTLGGFSFALCSPLNLPVSRIWFPTHEVNRAATVGIVFITIGTLLSFIVPVALVPNSENMLEIYDGLKLLTAGQAVIATAVFILSVLFFDEKPPTPVSHSQAVSQTIAADQTYYEHLKQAMNKNFTLVAIVYGFNTGGRFAFNALLNQLLIRKANNNTYYIGFVGVCGSISRVIICYVTSHFLDIHRKYKLMVYLYSLITGGLLLVFAFVLDTAGLIWIVVFGILIGGAMGPNTSTLMNWSAELTYPVPENIPNAVLVFLSYAVATFLIPIASEAIDVIGGVDTIIIEAILTLLTVVLIYYVKEDSKDSINLEKGEKKEKDVEKTESTYILSK